MRMNHLTAFPYATVLIIGTSRFSIIYIGTIDKFILLSVHKHAGVITIHV